MSARRRIHDRIVIDIATGRILEDQWYWYDGPVALAGGDPAWNQQSFAFYNDDGSQSTATIIGSVNANPTLDTDTTYHVRFLVQETSGNGGNNKDVQLEYNRNGAGWNPVNAASNVIRSTASGNLTDKGATTQRIGAGTFLTSNTWQDSADGLIGDAKTPDFGGNDECETVSSFQIRSADVSGGDTIQIRCRNTDGTTTFWTWTNTPTITVASSTVTGSGSPQADAATASGSGANINNASGTPQAATATASGVATQTHVASGSPQAASATASGAAVNVHVATGTPQADAATVSGAAITTNNASGAPQAELATASGAGQIVAPVSGSGSPQAATATVSGAGVNIYLGSGSPQAQEATVSGAGVNIHVGSGAVQANTATVSGSGAGAAAGASKGRSRFGYFGGFMR